MDVTKGYVDWDNEEDYAYVKDLDFLGCAWEFLRRLPDYRADWTAHCSLHSSATGGVKPVGKMPHIYNSSELEAQPDLYLSPSARRAKKWLLYKMCDPLKKYSPEISFQNPLKLFPNVVQTLDELDIYFDIQPLYSAEGEEVGELCAVPIHYGVVVFDLKKGLQEQWKIVQKALNKKAKAVEKSHPRFVPATTVPYLRMLDALNEIPAISTLEVYLKIYGEDNTLRTKDMPNETIKIAHEKKKQALERAHKYRDLVYLHFSGKPLPFQG